MKGVYCTETRRTSGRRPQSRKGWKLTCGREEKRTRKTIEMKVIKFVIAQEWLQRSVFQFLYRHFLLYWDLRHASSLGRPVNRQWRVEMQHCFDPINSWFYVFLSSVLCPTQPPKRRGTDSTVFNGGDLPTTLLQIVPFLTICGLKKRYRRKWRGGALWEALYLLLGGNEKILLPWSFLGSACSSFS
jgi:hypothetical protein